MPAPQLHLQCPRCAHQATDQLGARCPFDEQRLVAANALASTPVDPLVGTSLAPGLFIYDVLSDAGGFGRVYSAIQLDLGRLVAVKLLRPGVDARSPQARARFVQEARLLASLTHEPRIVTVHDCVVRDDGLVYMVLALAAGRPLSDLLVDGALAPERARHLMIEILVALDAAHRERLVHRDLKPDNVIVHGAPPIENITLIDFGIAKALAAPLDDAPRTRSGQTLGTPRYMAPEQLQRGGEVGPPTDVYAAGILLFELLTGRTPFDGGAAELVGAHLYEPPPPLPETVDPALAAVVHRALAKRPGDRYADAGAMAQALSTPAAGPPPIVAPVPTVDGMTLGFEVPSAPRWPWVVSAAALLMGAVVWLAWPGDAPVIAAQDAGALAQSAETTPAPIPIVLDAAPSTTAPIDRGPPDAAIADAAPASAAPASVAAKPRRRRPRVRRPARAPSTTAPPTAPASAPPTRPVSAPPSIAHAAPALVRRINAALRKCHCDQANALLSQAHGTAEFAALKRAIGRCTPPLPDIGCTYRTQ